MNSSTIVHLLLGIFLRCFLFLNIIALLISSFYRRKFSQPAPQAGFLLTAPFVLLYGITVFSPLPAPLGSLRPALLIIFLSCSAVSSSASAVALYLTMKKVRK